MEVVEITADLPGWLVVGRDLPALRIGHLLGQRGLLDAPRYPEFLLYALALAYLLLQALSSQFGEACAPAPLLGGLAPTMRWMPMGM